MKPIEVKARQVETIVHSQPKIDLNILKKRSTGRTSGGIVLGYMKKLKGKAPFEYIKVLESMYKDIVNLEISEEFKARQWKGKSKYTYIESPDKVICIRFQKTEPYDQAKEIRVEILKEEINRVLWAISSLNQGAFIDTSEVAEKVYNLNWKDVFSDRKKHILLCEIFNYLEYKGLIDYSRSGKVFLKKK